MAELDSVDADGADRVMETMGADAIDATTGAKNTKNYLLWEQGVVGSNPATPT